MMPNRIPTWLVKGCKDEDEQKDIVQRYEVARPILKKLRQEIQKDIERSYIDEEKISDLNIENVVRILGRRRGLREILELLPAE